VDEEADFWWEKKTVDTLTKFGRSQEPNASVSFDRIHLSFRPSDLQILESTLKKGDVRGDGA